jgi:hypothetical protein
LIGQVEIPRPGCRSIVIKETQALGDFPSLGSLMPGPNLDLLFMHRCIQVLPTSHQQPSCNAGIPGTSHNPLRLVLPQRRLDTCRHICAPVATTSCWGSPKSKDWLAPQDHSSLAQLSVVREASTLQRNLISFRSPGTINAVYL